MHGVSKYIIVDVKVGDTVEVGVPCGEFTLTMEDEEVISSLPVISNMISAMTFHDEQVPEVSVVEEVPRVPGEVTMAGRLMMIMRPCIMVMIVIIVMIIGSRDVCGVLKRIRMIRMMRTHVMDM